MIESTDPAFFRLEDGVSIGSDAARGPWSADACHAGPVTAVLVRALEQAIPGKQLARLTVTFHRPVPIAGFRTVANPGRDGRSVATAVAQLTATDGKLCADADRPAGEKVIQTALKIVKNRDRLTPPAAERPQERLSRREFPLRRPRRA